QDASLAAALVDRILHHGDVFYLKGPSWRVKDRSPDDPGTTTTQAAPICLAYLLFGAHNRGENVPYLGIVIYYQHCLVLAHHAPKFHRFCRLTPCSEICYTRGVPADTKRARDRFPDPLIRGGGVRRRGGDDPFRRGRQR